MYNPLILNSFITKIMQKMVSFFEKNNNKKKGIIFIAKIIINLSK